MADSDASPEVRKKRARSTVRHLMVEKYGTQAKLAKAAKLDPGTLGDFLHGRHEWAHPSTLKAIEEALDLPRGQIQDWADGREEDETPVPDRRTALTDATELDLVLELLNRVRERERGRPRVDP